jgi:glycosyltransferase involved in cell wall biosynthesis
VAVFVGSLRPEKQVALAVRTIARAEAWTLLVAGDGPERHLAENLASVVAPGRVRFLGHQRDIASVLEAADALLITSRTEGMPGAAIEAVLCGVPVVATPVGALATMHGVTVTDPDESALAQALDAVILPEESQASARATYSWEAVTRTWIQLLQTVASTGSAGAAPSWES